MARGLPAYLMKKVGKGQITMKQAWAQYRGKGKSVTKKAKKTYTSTKSKVEAQAKKMTVTKAMDLISVGAGGIWCGANYLETKDTAWLTNGIPNVYTGVNISAKTWRWEDMTRGYAPPVMRVLEKKVFKFAGVRPPRTQISTMGDLIDHMVYFGKTAVELYENKDSPAEATRQAIKTQFGCDMANEGLDVLAPQDMFMEKIIPYIFQKKARALMRKAGVKFGFS